MKKIIFYSWQSDLPNSTNRGLIQRALEDAAARITNDQEIKVEPVIDRDTKGIAGSPDIASTIFGKIIASDIFIADITLTLSCPGKKSTPNPNVLNVLIELGYALRSLGQERLILVFNSAYGRIEDLPFDLRTRRLLVYEFLEETNEKKAERLKLSQDLENAIREGLKHTTDTTPEQVIPALTAIEEDVPNKKIVLRKNLTDLLQKIDDNQPKIRSQGGNVNDLVNAIDSTQELVAEFLKIVEATAILGDLESAHEIYLWLGNILERYEPTRSNGFTSKADGDYFKFLGHEMLVGLIALFLRENKLNIISNLLSESIPVKYFKSRKGPQSVEWHYLSEYIYLLDDESAKRERASIHADILNQRHTSGSLSAINPMDEFIDADFFLFFCSTS